MHPLLADVDWLPEAQMFFGALIVWLKEWQFLVGGLIAVFAGAIIVNAINRQIKEQRLEVEERRRRLARAFRTSMPEDLQAICSYARRSAEVAREGVLIISAQDEGQQVVSSRGKSNKCPALPTYLLVNLKALIEYLDETSAERVADLLGCYYTQHIRLSGALENFDRSSSDAITVSKKVNFNPVFKDTLELYLRAKGMLEFARGATEDISGPFDASDVVNALRELNIEHVISLEAREHCLRFLPAKIRS